MPSFLRRFGILLYQSVMELGEIIRSRHVLDLKDANDVIGGARVMSLWTDVTTSRLGPKRPRKTALPKVYFGGRGPDKSNGSNDKG